MANIQKRGDDSWFFTVSLGRGADGKYIRRTKTVHCKGIREAEKEYAKFKVEVESGEYIAPEKMTFGTFVEEWRVKYAEKHLGRNTLEVYMIHLNSRIIPVFGHKRLDAITTFQLLDFFERLANEPRKDGKEGTLSPATVQIIHRAAKNVFSRAVDWKIIKSNPLDGVKKPRSVAREMDVYDKEEIERLFLALEKEPVQWRMMISLALTTGLRRGELLGLEWKHVDLEAGTIDVNQALSFTKEKRYEIKEPKTKTSKRKVSLPLHMIQELREYRRHCAKERDKVIDLWEGDGLHYFVFSSWNGKPLNPYSVKTWWKRFHKRHPMKYIRFHDLRHTSATLLLNAGVHAKVISSRLGHANITTTMNIYAHVLKEADQAAAGHFDDLFKSKSN